MKELIALGIALLGSALFGSGCVGPQSTFAFDLSGDVAARVHSAATVSGEVDNAGFFALDDSSWGLKMSLGGLAPGSRTVSKDGGELVIMSKLSGDVFSTTQGGSCTVWIDPHQSTNGSAVTGWFTCSGLAASNGKLVDVQGGRFGTFIEDTANNPRQGPTSPPV